MIFTKEYNNTVAVLLVLQFPGGNFAILIHLIPQQDISVLLLQWMLQYCFLFYFPDRILYADYRFFTINIYTVCTVYIRTCVTLYYKIPLIVEKTTSHVKLKNNHVKQNTNYTKCKIQSRRTGH
jgi:hypothetical protein